MIAQTFRSILIVTLPFVGCQIATTEDASEGQSIAAGDDDLKIAINYMGETNCRKYLKNLEDDKLNEIIKINNEHQDHRLDGKNGELISKEFKEVRRDEGKTNWESLKFSGDKFLETHKIARDVANIEANCRRIILSVDADAEPSISERSIYTVTTPNHHLNEPQSYIPLLATQRSNFKKDFATKEYGELTCHKQFCTFANIEGGKRYFVYVYPLVGKNEMTSFVKWTKDGEDKTHSIMIKNLKCDKCPQAPPTPEVYTAQLYNDVNGTFTITTEPHNSNRSIGILHVNFNFEEIRKKVDLLLDDHTKLKIILPSRRYVCKILDNDEKYFHKTPNTIYGECDKGNMGSYSLSAVEFELQESNTDVSFTISFGVEINSNTINNYIIKAQIKDPYDNKWNNFMDSKNSDDIKISFPSSDSPP